MFHFRLELKSSHVDLTLVILLTSECCDERVSGGKELSSDHCLEVLLCIKLLQLDSVGLNGFPHAFHANKYSASKRRICKH